MPNALRALFVEDSENDALLLRRELERGGFILTSDRVDTPEAMAVALKSRQWDIILSDYTMPAFSGHGALRLLKDMGIDLPFIVVSGTIGEEAAVAVLKAGAHDFVKKDTLSRLVPAIERNLREAALRAEQKQLQQQLMISDRMASVGTLAAGVAHEINNPLASVIANLELALQELPEIIEKTGRPELFANLRDELHDMREGAQRVRQIARDLRIFSRGDEDKAGPVDAQQVMESSLRIASNEIKHRATLVRSYTRVPPVRASESRLGQVFLNLIVNAAQAIGDGSARDNEIRVSTSCQRDGRIAIEVSDTGPGIPPDLMGKLFTPFFTTKPVGVGTGLGLSICHRIVNGFGGDIEVRSQPGNGATFRVLLLAAGNDGAPVKTSETPVAAALRRGRILVVDDEPMVADVLARTLATHHDVQTVNRAREARDMIAAGARFDVILSDLMMPEMTGMELHEELSRLAPDQAKVMIFLTGGAFTPGARAFLDGTRNLSIDKPFDPAKVRSLIAERLQ